VVSGWNDRLLARTLIEEATALRARYQSVARDSEDMVPHAWYALPLPSMVWYFGSCIANPMQPQQQRFWPDPRPLVERLGADFFRQLPDGPGVYLMHGRTDVVLYVGKAKSLKHRLSSYRVANPDRMRRRHLRLLQQVERIELEECPDEEAALAREAELLRTLKPKFNRAGVWAGRPRFLIWRFREQSLDLAISDAPVIGWREFGPCGSGVIFLRASLVRLLWLAFDPSRRSHEMPAGWYHGRLGAIASIASPPRDMELTLANLFAGDTEGFAAWISSQTQALVRSYDRETRDADLETVLRLSRIIPGSRAGRNAPARQACRGLEQPGS
jgi:hypothetical protein